MAGPAESIARPTAVGCLRLTVRLNTAVAIHLAVAVVSFSSSLFIPNCHVNLLFGRPEIIASCLFLFSLIYIKWDKMPTQFSDPRDRKNEWLCNLQLKSYRDMVEEEFGYCVRRRHARSILK